MPTMKDFGRSTVINMTQTRYCQDAYGKFPVLNICIRRSSAYRQVTACCTDIIHFTSFTSPSVINIGKKVCYFFPDLGVAVYLHTYSISILAGNVKRSGQVPLVSIRGSPCLQQSNAAVCVPVLHGAEQRGLTLAVHYIDRRAML